MPKKREINIFKKLNLRDCEQLVSLLQNLKRKIYFQTCAAGTSSFEQYVLITLTFLSLQFASGDSMNGHFMLRRKSCYRYVNCMRCMQD